MGIVLVHRRVPATNRGCIIHSLGYTRTGIAPGSLCVCVVSEQYRRAKVPRCRECDLRLNCRGYSAVTGAYAPFYACARTRCVMYARA